MAVKVYTFVELDAEPDCDLVRTAYSPSRRAHAHGMAGNTFSYHDAANPQNKFVQFCSDLQVGPSVCTIPAFVCWYKSVEA